MYVENISLALSDDLALKKEVITNVDIEILAMNCRKLKSLKLENCPNIHLKDKTLASMMENCPQLKKLSFHWVMASQISNKIWHKAISKSIDVFITVGKKTFTIQKYMNMMNSKPVS